MLVKFIVRHLSILIGVMRKDDFVHLIIGCPLANDPENMLGLRSAKEFIVLQIRRSVECRGCSKIGVLLLTATPECLILKLGPAFIFDRAPPPFQALLLRPPPLRALPCLCSSSAKILFLYATARFLNAPLPLSSPSPRLSGRFASGRTL